VTGRIVGGEEVCSAAYWRRQVREPVRFAEGMQSLVEQEYRTFLEVGPHPVLIGMGRQCVEDAGITWVSTLRRNWEEWGELLSAVGALYVQGVKIDWQAFHRDHPRRRLPLPTYPFQRERYWIESPNAMRPDATTESVGPGPQTGHPLLGRPMLSPRLTDVVHEVALGARTDATCETERDKLEEDPAHFSLRGRSRE
jgi:acyl transferase domain-containing protein